MAHLMKASQSSSATYLMKACRESGEVIATAEKYTRRILHLSEIKPCHAEFA